LKGPVQSVEVSYLLHATEDAAKVWGAVARTFKLTSGAKAERLEGHFGNVITRVSIHLTGAEASAAFDSMLSKLPTATRTELAADAPQFLDEHYALIIRFDKQRLVKGDLAIGSREPVRMKVKPRAFLMKGGPQEFYARLFGEG
jgi:RNA binding exosome subunit